MLSSKHTRTHARKQESTHVCTHTHTHTHSVIVLITSLLQVMVIIFVTTLLQAYSSPYQVQVQAKRSVQDEYHPLPCLAAVIDEDMRVVATPLQVVPAQDQIHAPSYLCLLWWHGMILLLDSKCFKFE